jgi:hypothetical protein
VTRIGDSWQHLELGLAQYIPADHGRHLDKIDDSGYKSTTKWFGWQEGTRIID